MRQISVRPPCAPQCSPETWPAFRDTFAAPSTSSRQVPVHSPVEASRPLFDVLDLASDRKPADRREPAQLGSSHIGPPCGEAEQYCSRHAIRMYISDFHPHSVLRANRYAVARG